MALVAGEGSVLMIGIEGTIVSDTGGAVSGSTASASKTLVRVRRKGNKALAIKGRGNIGLAATGLAQCDSDNSFRKSFSHNMRRLLVQGFRLFRR